MSEIPSDIWEAARALRGAVNWNSNSAVEHIALAFMAERESCAQIAQTHIPEGIHPDDLYRWRDTAGAIAAAIRSGN